MKLSSPIKKRIIITLGDPSGVGPEVVAKSLKHSLVRKCGQFLIVGDSKTFDKYSFSEFKDVQMISVSDSCLNSPSERHRCASVAVASLDIAIAMMKRDKTLCRLVTAPLSKESVNLIKSNFLGHTEYLANAFKVKEAGMFFVSPKLRVLIATRHIPLKSVSSNISKTSIISNIKMIDEALRRLYKIHHPLIAVCGLNPHAGENGFIGKEERNILIPAIKKAKTLGINVIGVFPADTVFQESKFSKFDAVLAMYHDQGLIPIKTLYFNDLVNLTVGLPILRVSPAHGTAFDIAGRNLANEQSMSSAIKCISRLDIE